MDIDSIATITTDPAKGKKVPSFWPQWTPAQPEQAMNTRFNLSYLDVEGGLSSSLFRCVLEDRDGRIWIGTDGGGINVWDGTGFTYYTTEQGLSHNHVSALAQSDDGKIWIGTVGGGLNMWDGSRFTHYTTSEGMMSNDVWSLVVDRRGDIWLGVGNNSFSHLALSTGSLRSRSERPEETVQEKEGLGRVKAFERNESDLDGTFTHYTTKSQNRGSIRSILEDTIGNLWLGASDGRAFKIVPSPGPRQTLNEGEENARMQVTQYDIESGSRAFIIRIILEDSHGSLWFGGRPGVSRYDPANDRITHYTTNDGLSGNSIFSLLEDSDGHIWIGSIDGGSNRYDAVQGTFTHFSMGQGLPSNDANSLVEDRHGTIWMSVWGHGLYGLSNAGFSHFAEEMQLGSGVVNSLLEDRYGKVWIGTHYGRLHIWDPAEGALASTLV